MRSWRRFPLSCIAGALVLAAAGTAQPVSLSVGLSGRQEVPPVPTAGTGQAIVTVDVTTGQVSVNGTYQGLTNPVTAAHIHRAPYGVNGGVVLGLTFGGGTFGGAGTLSATQIDDLLAGLLYLNVHTSSFPGGEIRGQIETVGLAQVDWDMEATGMVPRSEYGDARLVLRASAAETFVNVVARNATLNTTPAWVVQNLAVPRQGAIAARVHETGRVVDLQSLGIRRGASASGHLIEFTLTADPVPRSTPPPFAPARGMQITTATYAHGGEFSVTPQVPVLDAPRPANKPAWNGQTGGKLVWHRGFPNFEQGDDQCGPAALTNSMHWMDATYPEINLNGQTPAQTLAKFKRFTNWAAPQYDLNGRITRRGGIGQRDAIVGKLRFITDPTKTFPAHLVVRYQADRNLTDLRDPTVTENGRTARRVGAGGAPDFDFILRELQCGADVELSLDWLDNNGRKTGGHVVSVVGAFQYGNKRFLWTNDDATQGRKDGGGVPPNNGGLRTGTCHQITIENGGYMRLSGFLLNNRIKAVYSEKLAPLPLASFVTYGTGCPPTAPLTLAAAPGSLPVLGTVFTLDLTNIPSSSLAGAMIVGLAPANLDLSFLGMFRCATLTSMDLFLPMPPPTPPAMQFAFASIPDDPALVAAMLHLQCVLVAPGSNQLGVVTSSGGTATLGY